MLKDQIDGRNNSWAVRWHASLFLKDKYCLHPVRPIVTNIGLDGTGENCGVKRIIQKPVDFINLKRVKISESESYYYYLKVLKIKNKLAEIFKG
jgi:hypothetical protein